MDAFYKVEHFRLTGEGWENFSDFASWLRMKYQKGYKVSQEDAVDLLASLSRVYKNCLDCNRYVVEGCPFLESLWIYYHDTGASDSHPSTFDAKIHRKDGVVVGIWYDKDRGMWYR